MKDIFHISKLIIKKKLKILTIEDNERLKQFKKAYPFVKDVNVEKLVDRISEYETINKEHAWKAIIIKSENKQKKPIISIYKKNWFKFTAAAAVVGIISTSYFLKDNIFNNSLEYTPIIVNIIKKGTDKATLTLGDGSQIQLEKGFSIQTQSAKSNGEEIVYETRKTDAKETVYNYLTIPRGGQFFIKLSDGTKIWLNSESKLKYPVNFIDGETRQVVLVYGEAYFDVTPSTENKDSKFKVIHNSQEVEVFGTEFNIKAYKDEPNIYTTLVEGKVTVNVKNEKKKLLPNQQLKLNVNSHTLSVVVVDTYNETSWKEGIFSFEKKSLKDIMKVLSRWYDMDVVFENKNIEEDKFIGVLGKNQDIEEILTTIKNFKIIKDYEIKDKTIILK